ncbi:hypothetical protein [Streptomyces triculaminicus]|uniref:hypothetical protein n=1 Tax=Streptomyces triculaminicus TaxID=2816232 RepID=UPI0037D0A76F
MIDHMLRGAQLCGPVYTREEQAADERRLFQRIEELELRRSEAARTGGGWLVPTSPELAPFLRADSESVGHLPGGRVQRDLKALCGHVLRATGAQIADFLETDQPVDAVGARGVGCATYLRGGGEGARFWWRYAAGMEDATAAYLLFLEAILRGEPNEALHCYNTLHGSDFLADADWETATVSTSPPPGSPGEHWFHDQGATSPPPVTDTPTLIAGLNHLAGLISRPHRTTEASCSPSLWGTPSPC